MTQESQTEEHDETTTQMTRGHFANKPISNHPCLEESFDAWASACGRTSRFLRQATEHVIRSRHQEAIVEHESHKARGNQPDVFTLPLGPVVVFYSVESSAVLIRGYGWKPEEEPVDDFDGGGFYAEASW